MYFSKQFYTVEACLRYAYENDYEIVSILPIRFEKDTFDCSEAYKYDAIYK